MSKTVIISGSSRKDGDTNKAVQKLVDLANCDIVDLNDYTISYYDYEHKNKDDDFIGLMRNIIAKYNTLVFATPVYWYAMSGQMKVFFDRITDLLTIEKELGRKLRGKNFAAMSCSAGGGNLEDDFWLPFSESAKYLGMPYLGHIHILTEVEQTEDLSRFATLIKAN